MKFDLRSAAILLLAGMIVLVSGSFLKSTQVQFSNPVTMSGLIIEFVGTIWLVLSLNQRRKRHKG